MEKEELHKQALDLARTFKIKDIKGRYLIYEHIEKFLINAGKNFKLEELGKSTLGVPIESLSLGTGPIRILAWSQMHGNESTTTKAVLDVINAFNSVGKDSFLNNILNKCTFTIIPMLNPDGAKQYTRQNSNGIDLNRDACKLKEKESKVLNAYFQSFKPHFCFNLHDQRTIFSAGNTAKPATISFLTPSMDQERSVTSSRVKSMQVIASMAQELNFIIPGQIGRYDDAFNINCTGDTFQSAKVPTILFEAGHYQDDYNREKTRELIAAAILLGLETIASGTFYHTDHSQYFKIPENQKLCRDVILRNCLINLELVDVAIQFKEVLSEHDINFVPVVDQIGPNLEFFGHREIECHNNKVKTKFNAEIFENDIVDKIYINNEVLAII